MVGAIVTFSFSWTCGKCTGQFIDTLEGVKEKGHVMCGASIDKCIHIPVIVCDGREIRSGVPAELMRIGCQVIIIENMLVGDYIVSDRMAFESKVATDYLNDWLRTRELFGKLSDMKRVYPKSILILRGYTSELFEASGTDPAKVQACINTVARMGIPMVETINVSGTAQFLKWCADKEQNEDKRAIALHGKRSHLSPRGKKEYVVSSFPDCNVGRQTAIDLLIHFGTIEKVITADSKQLQEVKGIGKPTAEDIRKLLTEQY